MRHAQPKGEKAEFLKGLQMGSVPVRRLYHPDQTHSLAIPGDRARLALRNAEDRCYTLPLSVP